MPGCAAALAPFLEEHLFVEEPDIRRVPPVGDDIGGIRGLEQTLVSRENLAVEEILVKFVGRVRRALEMRSVWAWMRETPVVRIFRHRHRIAVQRGTNTDDAVGSKLFAQDRCHLSAHRSPRSPNSISVLHREIVAVKLPGPSPPGTDEGERLHCRDALSTRGETTCEREMLAAGSIWEGAA